MKILLIRNTPGNVNIKNVNYNNQEIGLARAFNRLEHVCDIVYWGGKEEKVEQLEYAKGKTFNVYFLKGRKILKDGIYPGIDKLLDKYDIVQSGGYDQIQSWILAKKIPEKLVIYNGTYKSSFNKKYNLKCKIIDAFFLKRYKKNNIKFITKSVLSSTFLKEKGLQNVIPIGVGIDLNQLQNAEMLESNYSKLLKQEKENGSKILLYIGRLEPRRNIFYLLDLTKELIKKDNKIRLAIIGTGKDTYKKKVLDYIKNNELEQYIIYQEKLEQKYLPTIYREADAFLLPTKYEIFGMVLLEAMYFGLPTFTTYNGGSSTLMNDTNGIVIDSFDINNWSKEIMNLLYNNKRIEEIRKKAHKTIADNYTWDALAKKFLFEYNKMN